MGYLDKHRAWTNISGNTIGESQFNGTAINITNSFADSPFYKVGIINGEQVGVRLMDVTAVTRGNTIETLQYSMKYMLFMPNTVINIGEIVQVDNIYWIVTDSVSDNSLFPKVKVMMCNYSLPVVTGSTQTIVGYDALKRPQYKTDETIVNIQSLVRSSISSNTLNQPINSPNDQLFVTVKYDDTSKTIKEDTVLTVHDRNYKVVSIDFANVINEVGCITFMASRFGTVSS